MISGLYAVTPDELDTDSLLNKAESALAGGVNVLQYRNKLAGHKLLTQQAQAMLRLCRQYNVPLIINDYIELCMVLDADGVHLGADDGSIVDARARLGPNKILGVSCYNNFNLALEAQSAGADYVAFGACFLSSTKPNAPLVSLDLFQLAREKLNIPTVAIGGVSLENAALAILAGANSIAVISAIFNTNDVEFTSKQFIELFQTINLKTKL